MSVIFVYSISKYSNLSKLVKGERSDIKEQLKFKYLIFLFFTINDISDNFVCFKSNVSNLTK